MRVAVVGGRLQGTEACYLAGRAGWKTILIDKNPRVPASGLCDDWVCLDVQRDRERLAATIRDVDFIIPAVEDALVLRSLADMAAASGTPLAYDPESYALTSSKRESDALFQRLGLYAPRYWPDCDFPLIVKPVGSSGSKGVMKIEDPDTLHRFLEPRRHPADWIVQEFLEGPSYSLEVVARGGEALTLQPTALEMDSVFDCKRVMAPVDLGPARDRELREIAATLARALHLNGIMDVEVVLHDGHLKVLEIDARLPSQTPTVVERSTGINMLALLGAIFVEYRLPQLPPAGEPCGVVYEHVRVADNRLEVSGEHIMAEAGPLRRVTEFFGADMALTDFVAPDRPWVATLIVADRSLEKAWEKRSGAIKAIMEVCHLTAYEDPIPGHPDSLKAG